MAQHQREWLAVGYIRCGLPDEWEDFYMSAESDHRIPSRSTKNRWFYAQKNQIRRVVAARSLKLLRCFFDAEGTPMKPVATLPLSRRRELAKLFIALSEGEAGTMIVDDRQRLDRNELVRALLCRTLSELGVSAIEARTGEELTTKSFWEPCLLTATERRLKNAQRQVRAFKSLMTRLKSGTTSGRKAFGQTEDEQATIKRVRELYRTLPRDRWKRRGDQCIKRRSFREIARCLNDEKVPTRTGAPWSDRMVSAILERLGLLGPKMKEPYEGS